MLISYLCCGISPTSTLAHNIGFTENFGLDSPCEPTDLVFFKGSSHAHAHQSLGIENFQAVNEQ